MPVRWSAAPRALEMDTYVVLSAAALAGAAGLLQFQLSSGERGLNAFLGKEKAENPFYSTSYKAEQRGADLPGWLGKLRLPNLDFVEVYGQPQSQGQRSGSASWDAMPPQLGALYRELDAAVERENYEEAAQIKSRIDAMLLEPEGDLK